MKIKSGYQCGKTKTNWRNLPKLYWYRKCLEKDSGGESCDVEWWHWLCWREGFLLQCVHWFICCFNQWMVKIFSVIAVVILAWIAFTSQLTSWFDVILVQRCIFQSGWFNVIGRVTIRFAQHLSQLQLTAGNRMFNPDTNTFSTSYARILCIPFINCPGGSSFFSPRRHNSRIRSWKGTGKVSPKALFAHATQAKRNTGLPQYGLKRDV